MGPPQPGPAVLPPQPHYSGAASMELGTPPPAHHAKSSSSSKLVVKVVCKAVTSALTFISLIILVSNNTPHLVEFNCTGVIKTVKFYEVSAYRYMVFIIVVALVYSLLQTAFAIFNLVRKKRVLNWLAVLDFYGDIVLLYALATAAASGFGATVDLQLVLDGDGLSEFFTKGNATSAMLFFASIFTAVSLALSKY
ncbi:hypothetical protein QQ045_003892 [Rhodiola kirilowii]